MLRCPHVQWLDIDRTESQWILKNPGRISALLSAFPKIAHQHPSTVFFVGKKLKTAALRNAFPENNFTRRKAHGIANLLLDTTTEASQFPILIADCTLGASCDGLLGTWISCHDNHNHAVCGEEQSLDEIISNIHANLIFLFSHVVCVFADDVGGNQACARQVEGWLACNSKTANLPNTARPLPHLIVITTGYDDVDVFMQVECDERFPCQFESLSVLTVENSTASLSKIKTNIKYLLSDARMVRQEQNLLLNTKDMAKCFAHAAEMFCHCPTSSIDLLEASQHPARSASISSAASHLRSFLSAASQRLPQSAVLDYLSTALLLQGYPPETHLFSPELLFDRFFCGILTAAIGALSTSSLYAPDLVRNQLVSHYELLGPQNSARDLRRKTLLKNLSYGKSIFLPEDCLWCGIRPSERVLRCGHSLCEECIDDFYEPSNSPYTYLVDICFICGFKDVMLIQIKPPTVIPSLLGFDGGGVRGIVALILAKRLQYEIDVPIPLWKFFELAVGTSIGIGDLNSG